MRKLPPIHLFPATVWSSAERRAVVCSCSRCFLALHEAGFSKVGTDGLRCRQQRACWLCRARKESDAESDGWRTRDRKAGIAALHAAFADDPNARTDSDAGDGGEG